MWQRLINAFSDKEIRRKIFISLALLLVFRLGCYVPVPGISYDALESAVGNNTLLGLMSLMNVNTPNANNVPYCSEPPLIKLIKPSNVLFPTAFSKAS